MSIRNDSPHRGNGPQLAGTATPEQVRAHIWGPWKFSADGCDDTGRTVAPQQLTVGEWTRYGLTPTTPPTWSASSTQAWLRDYANEPVRLSITARSKGSEWTTTGKKAADGPNPAALPTQASRVRMQKPPTPDPQPAPSPTGSLADAWSTTLTTTTTTAAPDPVSVPALAAEHHLPYTLAALRYARANDRTFPKPVDKRGAELLYRVGDLKKWARNRPRAAAGTTDLD
ncbi:hypothetical protein [Streptomyces sp. NRRL B-3648]|uniref:hypothetical protein n=1 Tax=Streptomyces sp. NRRL B-3648 TaxID=1519493 RepID=UPI0006AFB365|nr:hypothetical protein [Streptomyces sp. NRRL B-3648]KOV93737.1 hypothetical protein ADL04_26520 [Streptomyces sp. NRRL B-3648]